MSLLAPDSLPPASGFADTIVAIATPPGRGGVGVVRVSGPAVPAIAQQFLGKLPSPRYAEYTSFRDHEGMPLDRGLALYFPAPHSFTGEHVLELHGHGGPVVMDLLLQRVINLGARLARAGEFSERAFLNGKLDLAQAEAIADLIESSTEQAARAAQRSLAGDFSARIRKLIEQITELRAHVEAAIDFADDDVDFLSAPHVGERAQTLLRDLDAVLAGARQGSLLREGLRVVITGRPNVGKSSLLNCLAGREAAIVTGIPGTTRDVLREAIQLNGLPLHLMDTAGMRESGDIIEQEGMRRAQAELAQADHVLLVVDDVAGLAAEDRATIAAMSADVALTVVSNKCDLSRRPPQREDETAHAVVRLSATTGAGMDLLRERLQESAGYLGASAGIFSARRRHLEALIRARAALESGCQQLRARRAGELLAEELRQAQNALAEITGAFTTEDLLGRIFSSFCIGK
ncbi:MAG: tRNA uridine-5-carboxymethylaminomethyl(34) synthesis GTPase MnmE [Gammaproteobacteria bacterium]|nr:tRNA uridine-5-carboxymethylaminomethyl(34) synthesis GTPase MnmE [Gammaproteobacteria bacterium]